MEDIEVLELLAVGREHDRLTGDVADGQRRTAARVSVELGEDDTGEADSVPEGLRGVYRVLSDHRVNDEQDLLRLDGVPDRRGLVHHLGVDAEAPGRVDDHHVVLGPASEIDGVTRDLNRVTDSVAGLRGEYRDAGPLPYDLELGHCVGPLQISGDEHRSVTLLTEPVTELAREGRFSGALQPRQHDHRRRRLGELQASGLSAEDGDELLVDDLDDLLGGIERAGYLLTAGPLPDRRDELADHWQGNVRLEQRYADLSCRRVDVGVREPALAAQAGEDRAQAIGQSVE